MKTFGKYEVVEQIAVGGFGTVYRGFDPVIKRPVAIKACTSRDRTTRERFQLEAEIGGNLHHRNITTVHDFGIEGETPFLVQELLSGEDLDRKIKRRDPISPSTKLLYLTQIARGLEHAHSKGVVHRDLKPANIHVLPDGTVKIMDFGIARLAHQESGLTTAGQTVGTTAYLAPEQIRGEEVDQRADIFSFGALSYELLTYERAFKGDTISSLMYSIISERPHEIARHWADCPPALSALVERCLEKEPDGRPQGFAEIVGELGRIRVETSSQILPRPRRAPEPVAAPAGGAPTTPSPGPATPSPRPAAPVAPAATLPAAPRRAPRVGIGAGLAVLGALALVAALWLGSRPEGARGGSGPESAGPAASGPEIVSGGPANGPSVVPDASAGEDEPAGARPTPERLAVSSPARPEREEGRSKAPPRAAPAPRAGPSKSDSGPGSSAPAPPAEPAPPPEDPSAGPAPSSARAAEPVAGPPPPPAVPVSAPDLEPAASPTAASTTDSTESQAPAAKVQAEAERVRDVEAIRGVLAAYESAYEALDAAAVKRVWPTIADDVYARMRENFAGLAAAGATQRLEMDCREPIVEGERASVACRQRVTVGSGRSATSRESDLRIELERSGGTWRIRSLKST